MSDAQRPLSDYIIEVSRYPSMATVKVLPTGLYCRISGRELHWTARATICPDYIEERYIAGRAIPSCVFCRRSVNPKLDPDFKIPENENE